jgi:transcriptional regulator with XRE-family HTH domain
MTSTYSFEEFEAARKSSAMLTAEPSYEWNVDCHAWLAVLSPARSASSGIVTNVADYGPILPHVGSSSYIIDRRPTKRVLKRAVSEGSAGFHRVVALSIVEQMQELLAALSLNKSQLAQILRVTRPTVYDWFQGKEPNTANTERVHFLLRILARASVSGAAPLNARFVRQPMEFDSPSLIDLLGQEQVDEELVVRALETARALGDAASQRRTTREERLRALGFEDPTSKQRRQQLATTVALKGWPER